MPRDGVGSTCVEIAVLGKQRITANGSPLQGLRSSRTFEVLAYLIVHRDAAQLRQHVAGVFWPDSTDSQARTNLRRELHQLREALPDPDRLLDVDAQTVAWCEDAPCAIDIVEFETALAEANAAEEREDIDAFRSAAERAVAAYDGELLPGFYDDWVLVERERLRQSCVGLLDRLAAVLAQRGETRAACDHARRRVELEPLEESGYRRLMELQARAGDRAAAVATYHRCASVLQRELDVEPCAETVAVFRRLVAQAAAPVATVPPVPRDAPLVGRAAELAALRSAWDDAADEPRLVVVVGEAGIGKTRMAAELAHETRRRGSIVAHARCFASQGRVALAPVAEWLRSPALRAGLDRLDAVWRTEVARLVPELGDRERAVPPKPLADAWQRRRFLEGLGQAVLAGGRATLLVLDDLQWCDGETLAWLELLVHRRPSAPVLVVATLRAEERGDNPEVAAFCRRLRAVGILREVELGPLSAEDSATIAAALLDKPLDDEAACRLQADTGGVPLFVVEVARQGSVRSPRVEAVLSNRIAQLGAAARELAGAAAAVGREFSLELLGAVTDFGDETLVSAVDELWRRRLLRVRSGTTYDFSHDLLREAAYEVLSPPHRSLLHRRIADALERLHADRLASVASRIADQRERGGQPDRAVRYYMLAAEAATAMFALEEAVGHYDRGAALLADLDPTPERDRRELELRQALSGPLTALQGYASAQLGTCFERVVTLAEELGDEEAVVDSRVGLWAHRFVRGRIDDSLQLAQHLLARIADHPDVAGQVHHANAGSLVSLGRPAEALDHFRRAIELSGRDAKFLFGFHIQVMARAWRAHALWLAGRTGDAVASADAAVALAEELDHAYSQVVAQAYGAITYCLVGDLDHTVELASSVRGLCERYGFAYYGDWGRILDGWVTRGATGEALVRHGIDRLRSQHAATRLPFYLALLADVLAGSGRGAEASRVLADARTLADAHGDRWWLAELWRLDAELRPDRQGEAMLQRAVAISSDQASRALELRAVTGLARLWIMAGRPDEAVALLRPVRAQAGGCNSADVAAADEMLAAACCP